MKPSCPYCGHNPVPHHLYWYNESLNLWLTPLRQKLLYNPLARFFKRHRLDESLAEIFLFLGEGLHLIRRQKDIFKCKVRRAQVLWEEAQRRGIKMEELLLLGRPFDAYVAAKSGNRIIFSGLPRPAGYFNNRLDLMDDKSWLKKKLAAESLPVPAGGAVTSFAGALKIFSQISKPAIVKPRSGSRGRHSTTFVSTEAELKKAYKIAKQLCYWVIVEEQLSGPVYRATVVNFELCGVLRGDPPQVIGDGENSIAGLIKIKNSKPHPGVKDIALDRGLEIFLSRQKLSLASVPAENQVVNLSEKIGVSYGGSSAEDFEICHPENQRLFVRAAKVLGDPIVGFDFIIPDISQPWQGQKCGFIEVNSLPFINLHHDPLRGNPRNVAAKVWDMVGF